MALPPAYTKLLWRGRHTGSGASGFTSSGPASGLRWVVTDIAVQSGAISGVPRQGFALYDSIFANIFAQYFTLDGPGYYHWSGRQVWDNGDTWTFYSYDTGTTWRVTGFELTVV